ncbi:DUF5518 domain-containing protein [Haladaptatus sp. ZSTT2]|uniref:DUF5518 domain-containing protein n=1 Tax=Haladaptatus sp. ZSTT2 TaxID=3120515 RepID=UPI00300F650B
MAEQNIWVNALIGAVVAVIFSWIPFSPVLGGAIAGYLQKDEGLKVGALSGAISAIPIMGIAFLFFGIVSFFTISTGAPRGGLAVGLIVWIILFFVLLYTVVLSAVGGILGVYIAREA